MKKLNENQLLLNIKSFRYGIWIDNDDKIVHINIEGTRFTIHLNSNYDVKTMISLENIISKDCFEQINKENGFIYDYDKQHIDWIGYYPCFFITNWVNGMKFILH